MFRINSNWLSIEVNYHTRDTLTTYKPKGGPPSALDPQAPILKAGYGNDDVFLAHVGLILVRVSLGVHQDHG